MSQATYVQRGEAIDYTPTSDVAAGQVVVQIARWWRGPHADLGQHARQPGRRRLVCRRGSDGCHQRRGRAVLGRRRLYPLDRLRCFGG